MSTTFPIPIVWRKALDWFFSTYHAPHVDADRVTTRCGEHVLQVNAQDGTEKWDLLLARRAGDGTFFVTAGQRFVTDYRRHPERLSSIAALGADGARLWNLDLPSIVAPSVPATVGDDLFVLAMQAAVGGVLYRIDLVRGTRIAAFPTPWGADELVFLSGDRFLVRNQLAEDGSPGLYTMRFDATDPRVVGQESTWRMIRRGNRILTLSRSAMELPRRLHMLDAESLAELWTAPATNEAVDFYEDEVYSLETGEAGEFLIARRAEDGAVRWRIGPLTRQILRIDAGGPLVFCSFLGGTMVVERREGRLLGEEGGSYGPPTVAADRVYTEGNRALLCASLA